MHYFDHSATTPLHLQVKNLMDEVNDNYFGNPSSIHALGRKARVIIEKSRSQMAKAIGCKPEEIIFTSGGTEANNLILWNLIGQNRKHVVTSVIEHPAILKTLENLSEFGVSYTAVGVDKNGLINPHDVEKAIRDETGLISIMLANNEVGTIQPIADISIIAKTHGVMMHSDGVQALGKIPIEVKNLGVDCMSFSAHKFNGPKGTGSLFVKKGIKLKPLLTGGNQERSMRAGTENTAGIVGMGLAAEIATENLESSTQHYHSLVNNFKEQLKSIIPDAVYHGHPDYHLPGLISVSFPGYRNDLLMPLLDNMGMVVSSGSACSSGDVKPSKILSAMKVNDELIHSTLRISFGMNNSKEEISTLTQAIKSSLENIRSHSKHD